MNKVMTDPTDAPPQRLPSLDGVRGLAIVLVLAHNLLETHTSPEYFRLFAARRALRIFPPYCATLLVCSSCFPRSERFQVDREHQVWLWPYLVNGTEPFYPDRSALTHFWSLAICTAIVAVVHRSSSGAFGAQALLAGQCRRVDHGRYRGSGSSPLIEPSGAG